MARGRYYDPGFRDPHLYYGVPVDVMEQALPRKELYTRYMRFWYVSRSTPDKAWVVTFNYTKVGNRVGWYGEQILVPLWGVQISRRPAEPPPMPDWAVEIAA